MVTKFIILLLYSNIAEAQVPNAPTSLVVTPINNGGMIQFTNPSDIGGSSITNYEYTIDNGVNWIAASPSITASPLIIKSGLTNCTSYQLKLRAVNNSGSGAASSMVDLTPTTSVDIGINWTSRTSATNNSWSSVTYGNGLFVAVSTSGTGNRVMTSPDGITWTSRTSVADIAWNSVTFGNGLFVSIGSSGTGNRVMTSPDGINWTSRTSAADINWLCVTYGNGLFVAVSNTGTGNRVMTSPDGITWTSRTSAVDNNWTGVTYGNGLFVAVAATGTGNRVMTSPDGVTWTSRSSAADNSWRSVTYGNGLFVAVSNSGTGNRVMTSPNGITWTSRTSSEDNAWQYVTNGNGLFVAVASGGTSNRVMTSLDGINWTSRTSTANNWYGVTYGNGLFVAVSTTGTNNRVITNSYSVAANAPVITSAIFGSTASIEFYQSNSVFAPSISNYKYSTDNGSIWTTLSPAVTSSPINITGLAVGTNSIMLQAVNSIGSSCYSNNYIIPSCTNPSSGGIIAAAQSGNSPFNPDAFTSSAAATGQIGTLEYKWQSSNTSSSAGFSDIASSDVATYDAGALTQTTWFKRVARVGCKTDWTGAAESNVLEVTVNRTNTWTGGSGNWNNISNWSQGVVPTGAVDITISSGTTTLDVDYTLAAGSTLTLSGTGALIIAPGKTLTIAGTADFGGKSVTIKSTADGTGAIGQITGTLSNATNVTQERYLPASSNGRAYRLISPGVNTTGSLRANWMESGLNTSVGSNSNPNPGYGVQVTGAGGNANGFDVTASNAASVYTTVNGTTLSYASIANTTDPLNALTGYFVFVRGDRSQDLTKANTNVSPNPVPLPTSITTLRATGTVVQGTQTSFTNALVSTNGAMNLITNPYPSAIDWAQVYAASSNIGNYYTLWDPKIGFRGGFVTVTTAGVKSDNSSSATTTIQPGQAFFVTATGGGTASVTLQEAHKTSTGVSNAVFGFTTPTTNAQLSVGLYYKEASGNRRLADGVKAVYGAGYQKTLDANDAFEIPNWDENLAIKESGQQLSIETRPIITGMDTLPLQIGNMKNMNYELQLEGANFSNPLLQAVLVDRYLQTNTPLNLNTTTVLPFSVNTATPASYAADRFSMVFSTSATLPLKFRSILGQVKGAQTQLQFEVETEANVIRYEVEQSTTGEVYTTIGKLLPKSANNLYNSYQWQDAARSGSSYYRIKAVSVDGSVQYSKVLQLTLGNRTAKVQAYPNPLRGKEFRLQLDQLEAGSYRLDWYNGQGQLLKTALLQHPGGFYQHQPVLPTTNGTLQWKLSKGTNQWKGTVIQ